MSLDCWRKLCRLYSFHMEKLQSAGSVSNSVPFCCDVTVPPGSSFVYYLTKEPIKVSSAWWCSWFHLFPSQTLRCLWLRNVDSVSTCLFTCNTRLRLQTSSAKDQLSGRRWAKSASCVRGMRAAQRLWLVALAKLERNYHSFLQHLRNAGVWTEGSLRSTQNMNVRNLFFQNP